MILMRTITNQNYLNALTKGVMSGKLTLIPTPIDDESPLCTVAVNLLLEAAKTEAIIAVEELKEGRRRWLRYGLPRESIDGFVLYNEHTHKEECQNLTKVLKSGKDVYLMSDCGLPAFCDPGRSLVEACHRNNLKVTATPFANSIALAVALSGFPHDKFMFEGFLPAKSEDRSKEIKRVLKQKCVSIIMDTPYRLKKLIDELAAISPQREVFIGLDLNASNELLLRGKLQSIQKKLGKEKREFVLLLGPLY